jgi:hypothetical protein
VGGWLSLKNAFFTYVFDFYRLFTTFFCIQSLDIIVIIVIIKVSKSLSTAKKRNVCPGGLFIVLIIVLDCQRNCVYYQERIILSSASSLFRPRRFALPRAAGFFYRILGVLRESFTFL